MSYGAIKDHIAEIYQLEVSEATISSITVNGVSTENGKNRAVRNFVEYF